MVWVGLLSYSAYVWHWPLLAFFRYGHREVGPLAGTVILALTLFLAWLTHRFVERPARRSKASTLQVFLRQFALPAGALALFALAAMKLDGYSLRWFSTSYKSQQAALRQETMPAYSYKYVCQRQKLKTADAQDARHRRRRIEQCPEGDTLGRFQRGTLHWHGRRLRQKE